MELHERIKKLRKEYLNLSQEAFGKKLGVSRSVINNIERNCLARPEQKLSLIKLMCKEFNVNEDWILHGIDPMINKTDVFSFDEFLKEKEATELEIDIMKIYLSLDKNVRRKLMFDFKNAVLKEESVNPHSSENVSDEISVTEETEEEIPTEYKNMTLEDMIAQNQILENLIEKKQVEKLSALQKQNENSKMA